MLGDRGDIGPRTSEPPIADRERSAPGCHAGHRAPLTTAQHAEELHRRGLSNAVAQEAMNLTFAIG